MDRGRKVADDPIVICDSDDEDEGNSWACSACTYDNPPLTPVYKCCGALHDRPGDKEIAKRLQAQEEWVEAGRFFVLVVVYWGKFSILLRCTSSKDEVCVSDLATLNKFCV